MSVIKFSDFRFRNQTNHSMKKIIFVAAIGIVSCPAFAQNGCYLSSSFGAGISNANQNFFATDPVGQKIKKAPIFSYSACLGAGYQFGHFRIETGVQYGVSGYRNPSVLFGNVLPETEPRGSMSTTYRHLSIPVKVGYEISLGEKLKLVPVLGMLASYNLGASLKSNVPYLGDSKMEWDADAFETQNQRISVWATAAIRMEYKLSRRFSLFAGPSMQYMVSDLLKTPEVSFYDASQRNYNMHLDLGLIVRL